MPLQQVGFGELLGIGRGIPKQSLSRVFQIAGAGVERVAFCRQNWTDPFDKQELLSKIRRQVLNSNADAPIEIQCPKDETPNLMQQDCTRAHEARFKGCEERHLTRS